MSLTKHDITLPPHADEVEFDPSNCPEITSDNVQDAIDELCSSAAISASPGFTFNSPGNASTNTWLQVGQVVSNKTGINFPLYNGFLFELSVSNENNNTFDVELYEHDGSTFTLLTTVSIIAQRSNVFDSSDFGIVNITRNLELAAKVVNGSAKNPVVQIIAKGTETP